MVRILVVYDIGDNVDRQKLADDLFRMGLTRIQRSAFAGELDPQRLKDLQRIVGRYVKKEEDVIHIFTLGLRDWEKRIVIGREWGLGTKPISIL
jgi:CRISPR-associated protein Cas2